MKKKVFIVSVMAIFICGCSDNNQEAKGDFMEGCVNSGAPKSNCYCVFEKLEEKYSPAELKQLNQPIANLPEKFLEDMINSALSCRK